jgi:hypothetical protein
MGHVAVAPTGCASSIMACGRKSPSQPSAYGRARTLTFPSLEQSSAAREGQEGSYRKAEQHYRPGLRNGSLRARYKTVITA